MADKPDVTIFNEDEKGLEVHIKEEEVKETAKRARDLFSGLQDELEERGDDFTDGLSFLDLKNDIMMSYMIDICNIILRKIRNERIEGHKSVERCIEYRVILEKIKGIDQKLAYQVNKLITMPEEEERLDVRNLDIEIEEDAESDEGEADEEEENEDEEEEEEQEDEQEKSDLSDDSHEAEPEVEPKIRTKIKPGTTETALYRPPKLRSVAYKQRDHRSHEFYQDEDPNVIVDESRARVDEARIRYEEDNFTRLAEPKKKKRKYAKKSKK